MISRHPQYAGAIERERAGEAEELHRDIGDDGAGLAEQIVDRRRGRVIEAGVGDRPG